MTDILENPDEKGKPTDDLGWVERESEASVENPPKYPYNNVIETESGHLFEMDDTPGRERIRLQHSGNNREGVGSWFEFHSNGDRTTKIIGTDYEITLGKKNVYIKGACFVTIDGDAVVDVKGNKFEKISGDYYLEVGGDMVQTVAKKASIISDGDMDIGCGDPITGRFGLSAGDHFYLNSDLVVAGSLTADMVTAQTKVQAGTQVNAGPLGFVSELGGLGIGVPVAAPLQVVVGQGSVFATQTVNAGVSVNSPLINGIIVRDILGTMQTMRDIYNFHQHPGVRNGGGITLEPLEPML